MKNQIPKITKAFANDNWLIQLNHRQLTVYQNGRKVIISDISDYLSLLQANKKLIKYLKKLTPSSKSEV